ncbi:MAG: hypothetical protein ABW019_14810 [Chitinophagaceae bacterium]
MVKTVSLKPYKKQYLNVLVVTATGAAATLLLGLNGLFLQWDAAASELVKQVFLFGMIGLALLFTFYMHKQKEKLYAIAGFDEKMAFYEKFYAKRMWWYVLSCAVSCFLYLLTAKAFFLYFAFAELVMLLIVFPNQAFFKKELNDDGIIFT